MTSCEVVGCIFFATNQLLGVKELAIGAGAHLIHDCRLLSSSAIIILLYIYANLATPKRGVKTQAWWSTQAVWSNENGRLSATLRSKRT